MNPLVEAVKKHAIENYEKDGWDIAVECYDDATLASMIRGETTEAGAIKKVHCIVSVLDEVRSDIQGS